MRLMPIEKRDKLKCYNCGKSPVKYYVKDIYDSPFGRELERPYCSRCALILSFNKRDSDTYLKDEVR